MKTQLLVPAGVAVFSSFLGVLAANSVIVQSLIDRGGRPLRVSRLEIVDKQGFTRGYLAVDKSEGVVLALLDGKKSQRIRLTTAPEPQIRASGEDGTDRMLLGVMFDRPFLILSDKRGPRISMGSVGEGCIAGNFDHDPWQMKFHAPAPRSEITTGLYMSRDPQTGRVDVRSTIPAPMAKGQGH